ncbi:hypothetical protein LTR97_011431 [Elasticomyces elasticus]|uniref:Fructose-bisphosphate aldolase n=1 Tax=Elasticomyces elasticus TaxID=574655 RepID=A0AAN7VY65_9PEZI|nr:hypothetical protein LTR97_011431 [Elasticomyces elasticus]
MQALVVTDAPKSIVTTSSAAFVDPAMEDNPALRVNDSSPVIYESMLGDWTFWCRTCAAKYTVDRAPPALQQRAGLCLPCFKIANPGWVEFKRQLELRLNRIKRYKNALGDRKSEGALARLTKVLDPRTTGGALPLDWALWRHVYEPSPELQETPKMQRDLNVYYKLQEVEGQMDRYLMWMQFIDDRERICPHKVVPPVVDKLAELGEWPQWECITEDLRDSVKGWATAECGIGCKLARGVVNSIIAMAKSGINKAKAIVDAAAAGGWAVPAMCLYNVEGIIASVRAAEAKSSPVILQLFPWAVEYADGLLVHAAAEAASKAKVPVAVHMDHCQSPEMVRRAADLGGFDGIMVDMSHYEKEENLAKTKELTEYCHARGIITEAEPGRINGGEDGVSDTADLEGILTTPEQADEFIATGIDWLAPAFGNVHGKYGPKGPQLEYDRLQSIRSSTKGRVELVLHGAGAEYFNEKLLQECIGHGIAKCNINDIVNAPFMEHLAEHAKEGRLTALIEDSTAVIQKHTEKCMDWMGSTGKADSVKLE